jgi:O-antigen ligase
MTAAISTRLSLAQVTEKPSHSVRLLQIFAVAVMVLPGDYVVKVIGADGYGAALVAYLMFIVWTAGSLLGQHNPFVYHYPTRVTLGWMWVASLASYVAMNRATLTAVQTTSADRWLLQLLGMSGVVLVAAEGLPTLEDVRRVIRALTWGGAVCGIVAGLQFEAKVDLTKYLKLPGFGINAAASSTAIIVERGTQNRVPGTATDPIEMGVAMGMLLALAVYLLMYDKDRPKWRRIVPFACILVGTAASVSRSAIIAVIIAVGGLIISLPPTRRLKGLIAFPVAIGLIAVAAPGLIETLVSFFLGAKTDPSITHRTSNYPYVLHLVQQAPWLGQGGGTYIPAFNTNTLDNEYLVCPAITALVARRHTTNPELRDLCAALGSAELAAVVTSGTFDSFSFPMFYNLQALIAGLAGAVWLIVHREGNNMLISESKEN